MILLLQADVAASCVIHRDLQHVLPSSKTGKLKLIGL